MSQHQGSRLRGSVERHGRHTEVARKVRAVHSDGSHIIDRVEVRSGLLAQHLAHASEVHRRHDNDALIQGPRACDDVTNDDTGIEYSDYPAAGTK